MTTSITRRSFLAAAAAAGLTAAQRGKRFPIALELYSVRNELTKDLMGTVRGVAKMGYDGVEFYSPYFSWTTEYAKEVRKLLDDLGIRCFSTHNGSDAFDPEKVGKAIELNQIIGSKLIVMASAGRVEGLDGWKKVADKLNAGAEKMKAAGLRAGYHNHQGEFMPVEGKRPIEVLAANTTKDIVLQLDVGTCVHAGSDPVAWIQQNPGRFATIHCKDYSPEPGKGYEVLFGEGAAPWKKIFAALEETGGLEYYIIEQEGSRFPAMETAEKCLQMFREMHG